MGWADNHIKRLQMGRPVWFRPRGNSMSGKIESGAKVTVEPVDTSKVKKGDIVLCRVNGNEYLHLVKAIQEDRFLIGNNRGGTNGWTSGSHIYGICTKIER